MSTIGKSLLRLISAVPVGRIAVGVGVGAGVGAGVKVWLVAEPEPLPVALSTGRWRRAAKTADWWNLGLAIVRRWESCLVSLQRQWEVAGAACGVGIKGEHTRVSVPCGGA